MIRKTLLLCISVISFSLVGVNACNSTANADLLSSQAEARAQAQREQAERERQQNLSVWESDLCDASRFKLNVKATEQERKIARSFAKTFERRLKDGNIYIHYLLSELKKNDLPIELVAIPMLESGLNTKAKSRSGAHGMWQYMRHTGNSLGLHKEGNYDEIYDFTEATKASLKYFKHLYEVMDHNWDLAAAAYNQGEYGVKRALENAKARGVKDININTVKISPAARAYVNRFHAFADLLKNPQSYGITPPHIKNRPAFKRVEIAGRIDSMKKASEMSGVSLETLKVLNAGYLSDSLKSGSNHGLIVPVANASRLESAIESYKVSPRNDTADNRKTAEADKKQTDVKL